MAYREWLTDFLSDLVSQGQVPAKAQRRQELLNRISRLSRSSQYLFLFAALRLCGKLLLVTFSLSCVVDAQTRRPLAPADILRVANVSDAQISPNGEWIAYSVSTVEGDATRSTLWLVRSGGEVRPLARTPTSTTPGDFTQRQQPTRLLPAGWYAANARWAPDSRSIAFLAEHEGLSGLWTVTLERGQPRFLAVVQNTNFFITYAGEPFAWSPDGKLIAYVSANEEAVGPLDADHKDDPRVIDRLQYKSRTAFSDRRRSHIYYTFVDNPEPRQLTFGLYYDHALTFSPRGDEVAFLSNHESDPDANNNSDIFAVDLHGQVRQITNTKGCEYEPTWSPDGRSIAYVATKRDVTTIDSVAEDTHVWVIDAAGGGGRELTADHDRRVRTPHWSADNQFIFFLSGDHGCNTLFSVAPGSGKSKQILGNTLEQDQLFAAGDDVGRRLQANQYQVTNFSIAQRRNPVRGSVLQQADPTSGALIAFTLSTPIWPAEVWVQPVWTQARRLTRHNEAFARTAALSEPEEITFKSFDGTRIQGWLIRPVDWRSDRRYPLILSIHGGPHGMSGWALNPTLQVYAARGYAVLYLNPRGSSGYGQKFSDGTLNEWGGGDYKDLMNGVDEALRRYSWIDADRMGVTGGSYGGFMTNWIITQTPRFKAAVAAASVSNLISFYSTSLYQDLMHAEFGGFPWDNYDLLWQWSPLRYARQAQTPTLFIHGEQDNDVHITQAEEMYMALKRRGVQTVLLRYPREGHGFREPRHRVDALERTLAWFDRYLK
ncbi:MAG: ptpA 5 [Acidobacteria bacterium]|nr:ptpA 5 [Acidobacteriota bacterium]